MKIYHLLLIIPALLAVNVSAHRDGDTGIKNVPNVFPAPSAIDAVESDSEQPVSNTSYDNSTELELHGIFICDDARIAYISIGDSNQQEFSVGQKITDCCHLQAVFRDRVIIRAGKQDITLKLASLASKQPAMNTMLPYRPPPALPAHASAASLQVKGIKKIQPNFHHVERSLIKKEIKSGLIFSQAKILPEKEGGFFIERIKEGSLVEAIGLHVGDTIEKINNKPLDSIFDAIDLFDQIDKIDSLEMQINRSGSQQYLYYKLQ
jgi:type II secretion system protein C